MSTSAEVIERGPEDHPQDEHPVLSPGEQLEERAAFLGREVTEDACDHELVGARAVCGVEVVARDPGVLARRRRSHTVIFGTCLSGPCSLLPKAVRRRPIAHGAESRDQSDASQSRSAGYPGALRRARSAVADVRDAADSEAEERIELVAWIMPTARMSKKPSRAPVLLARASADRS